MPGVIQGSFPNGLPRNAQPQAAQPFAAHATPAWVQARIGHHAPQPQTVQRQVAPPHPNAMQLPQHVTPFATHGGQPLPTQVLQRMEAAFGAKFGDVRVHITPQVNTLGASAVTHGSHIHFAPGKYDPHTHQGQQLIGRELAHVVQQRAGRVHNPFGTGTAIVHDHTLEAEAERMAIRATAVQRSAQPVIQRLKRITDMVTNPFERVSRQEMLRRYTFYLMSVAGEYGENTLVQKLQTVYTWLLTHSPDTLDEIKKVRRVLDGAASILRGLEQPINNNIILVNNNNNNNNNTISISITNVDDDDYSIPDYSSFKKETKKLTHRDFKNKNKNNSGSLPKFISLDEDVKLGLYQYKITKSTKIQKKSGMDPFPDQSKISVSEAVKDAIDVISVWESTNAAYSRHDFQDTSSSNYNLQIQLGGSKLNYRPGKGDSSCTLVLIETTLFERLREQDPDRLKQLLVSAHKLSFNGCQRVDITEKE